MVKRSAWDSLEQYARFADALVESASKDELARCARLLALAVARYRAAYGELPEVESLLARRAGGQASPDARALADGMRNLVSTLASVTRPPEDRSAA